MENRIASKKLGGNFSETSFIRTKDVPQINAATKSAMDPMRAIFTPFLISKSR